MKEQPLEQTRAAQPSSDRLAADLRGFGPFGIVSIVLILFTGTVIIGRMIALPVGAVLVLVWVWLSRTPWREIGYVRPKSWLLTVSGGIAFGIALKLLMKAIVMPLLGAPAVNSAYHFLAGDRALLPAAVWAMLVAGFGEETLWRGFVFERMGKLFGSSPVAKSAIVLLTSVVFGLDHYAVQGLPGAEQAVITGLVFGTITATTGRIVMVMFAHAAFDLTALAIIYWGVESRVANLIFDG